MKWNEEEVAHTAKKQVARLARRDNKHADLDRLAVRLGNASLLSRRNQSRVARGLLPMTSTAVSTTAGVEHGR